MADKVIPIEEILALLEATPERLTELSAGLTPTQLRAAPAPGEWSANDVLAHLRACADVWGGCMARIAAEDHPTIKALNPRTWMTRTDYPALEFRPSLEAFVAQRVDLLAFLKALPPDAWARAATVTGAGKPLEKTFYSFAWRLAIHERPHVKQFARTVKAIAGG